MDKIAPSEATGLLPHPSPLPMPVQILRPAALRETTRDRLTAPRLALLLLTAASTAAFANVLYQVLSIVHLTPLQGVFLVFCTLCFAWIALGSSSALIGFISALGRSEQPLAAGEDTSPGLTALLFPVYNEDAARIAATIEAIADELANAGHSDRFEFFVLSDSRIRHAKTRELRAIRHLRKELRNRIRLFYRSRAENIDKKAGNIADWVQRFGGAYESFIILDADSIMSGSLIARLQSMLANNDRVGLIQTVPRLIEGKTLFAQLQQFAVAFYGPIVAAGFAAWHQGSGNYWGHNAIIRTRAFAEAAGLPNLPGRPPLGGHVQSHDFVEAAFLRRAGWEVWMLPRLEGSYEGCPPTLIDTAVRDRRWAQGNLQHLRVVSAAGLPWVSRLHLAMGTYGYLSSVFWAISLAIGVILSILAAYTLPVYFSDERTLFPIWPTIDPIKAFYLFIGTIAVVLLPKTLGIGANVFRRSIATRHRTRFLLGALAEILLSILLAPVFMLTQTTAVLEVLAGRDSGWAVQRRDGESTSPREALRFHKWHIAIGVAGTVICSFVSVFVLAWMGPILIGLLLSAYLSVMTSRPPPAWLERALATPEAISSPPICASVASLHPKWLKRLEPANTL